MSILPPDRNSTSGLAGLLRLRGDEAPQWGVADLRAIWLHQMTLHLSNEIDSAAWSQLTTDASPDDGDTRPDTFGELLQNPSAPLGLLRTVKDYAKKSGERPDLLPKPIALAIYYAVIANGQIGHGQNLGQLDAKARQAAFAWCLAQPWLDEATRSLFRQAMTKPPQ